MPDWVEDFSACGGKADKYHGTVSADQPTFSDNTTGIEVIDYPSGGCVIREPRKQDLLPYDDTQAALSGILFDLNKRNSMLRQAKHLLALKPGEFVPDGYTNLKLTREEALLGLGRALIDRENAVAKAVAEFRDSLTDVLAELLYRPPIEAEA